MKYLFMIAAIAVAATLAVLFFFRSTDNQVPAEAILSVNGHVFTRDFFNGQQEKGYHSDSEQERLNNLITRELLIQEAQKQGIDREEAFRKALKNYYEQSLIKILTDRQYRKITATVSEHDIDEFLACYGKKYTFTLLTDGPGEAVTAQHTMLFDNLSDSLRVVLAGMRPGETREIFNTGSGVQKIRLDGIAQADAYTPVAMDREQVRMLLQKYRESQLFKAWIEGLRNRASIITYTESDRHE